MITVSDHMTNIRERYFRPRYLDQAMDQIACWINPWGWIKTNHHNLQCGFKREDQLVSPQKLQLGQRGGGGLQETERTKARDRVSTQLLNLTIDHIIVMWGGIINFSPVHWYDGCCG